METLDGASKEERLPVLLSGIGGTKLLGVPAIQSTNSEPMGKQIALHTVALLVEWNCNDSVCGRKTISKIFCRLLKMTGALFPINVKGSLLPNGGL